jgi:phthalate 4,5-dioxygenase reductase subunit
MSDLTDFVPMRVVQARWAARDIRCFELRMPGGEDVPAFEAGAHVCIRTPSGDLRHYSLCNDPQERDRYVIAVKRESQGRGGSRSLVDNVQVGDVVPVKLPENQFALDERARSLLLVAGGIGITPMLSMARALLAEGGRDFRLIVLTRDAQSTAFLDELQSPPLARHVTIHHDGGDPARALDLWPLLEKPGALHGRHVYCCGPQGLMDSVRDMTGHWSAAAVHFESFGADTRVRADDKPFELVLARSGLRLNVPVGRSALQVLREHGVKVISSCESGTCGSCRTTLLDGQADHRDLVLLDEEKASQVMVCVSRAVGDALVLDL